MTIQEAVKKIIELRGLEIFKNSKQFFASIGDFAPEYPKELRMIRNNFDDKLLALFIDDNTTIGDNYNLRALANPIDLYKKGTKKEFEILSMGIYLK